MAMANLRDGGRIIIGVEDNPLVATGIKPEHEGEYRQDAIYQLVSRYTRHQVDLAVISLVESGKRFIGIEIAGFDRTPIFCNVPTPNEAGSDGLRVGDLPGRDFGRIATTRVHDPDLVEEIFEVAAEKRARSIIAQAQRIGLTLPDGDAVRFEKERRDFGEFE